MSREPMEVPMDDNLNEQDDTPVEVIIDEKEAKKTLPPEQDPQSAIEQMRQQLEAERYARQQAERAAYEAAQAANKATSKKADTEVQMVKSAIKTLKRDTKMLRQAYTDALNVGDTAEAARINEKLIETKDNLKDLEKGYKPLKNEAKQAKQEYQPNPVQQVAPTINHRIDQIISQVTPRAASWLNQNRSSIPDEATIQRMFRAHEDAVFERIEPDSDAYFRYIEGRLGLGQQRQQSEAQPARQTPPPAAPVNSGYGPRSGVVTLTRQQAQTADAIGMSHKEYALQLEALRKEGKIA